MGNSAGLVTGGNKLAAVASGVAKGSWQPISATGQSLVATVARGAMTAGRKQQRMREKEAGQFLLGSAGIGYI